jgi:hypothetical protein
MRLFEGGTMEKVAGTQYYSAVSTVGPTNPVASNSAMERSPMIRGHHSSISKAVDAHRQMVEQRSSRNGRRDLSMMANTSDVVLAQQISGDGSSTSSDSDFNSYENTLIESPSTQAKMASIQSFQSTEPERPLLGEPVPKGSYLDIEA